MIVWKDHFLKIENRYENNVGWLETFLIGQIWVNTVSVSLQLTIVLSGEYKKLSFYRNYQSI